MRNFDPHELVRGLDPIELIELREAMADFTRRAADRAALWAEISDFCAVFYGHLKKTPAAKGFIKELLEYRRTDWPRDKARGNVHPRAENRRAKLFKIMRLCHGEPYQIRTIQKILANSGKF